MPQTLSFMYMRSFRPHSHLCDRYCHCPLLQVKRLRLKEADPPPRRPHWSSSHSTGQARHSCHCSVTCWARKCPPAFPSLPASSPVSIASPGPRPPFRLLPGLFLSWCRVSSAPLGLRRSLCVRTPGCRVSARSPELVCR